MRVLIIVKRWSFEILMYTKLTLNEHRFTYVSKIVTFLCYDKQTKELIPKLDRTETAKTVSFDQSNKRYTSSSSSSFYMADSSSFYILKLTWHSLPSWLVYLVLYNFSTAIKPKSFIICFNLSTIIWLPPIIRSLNNQLYGHYVLSR